MPGGRVVFVVDRDQAVRDSLRFSIELEGMDVRTCASGTELLAHPEINSGSCAIVDGKTLDEDGDEFVEKLRARSDVLPVVLIVDHVSRRLLSDTIGQGVFHIVEKPVMDDALLHCVRTVCRP
jgi:two-component system response regulator FixJ